MAGYAPAAILNVFNLAKKNAPGLGLQLSGVIPGPNEAHYGYHWPRNSLPSSDYSLQRAADRQGDANACSALDIKPSNTAGMITLTKRLQAATKARDPRITACVREFFGTTNGATVTGLDVPGGYVVTADSTHLWHVHISFTRAYATNTTALAGVAAILAGQTVTPATPPDVLEEVMAFYANKAAFENDLRAIVRAEVQNIFLTPAGKPYWRMRTWGQAINDHTDAAAARVLAALKAKP